MCELLPWWDSWLGPALGLSLGLGLSTLFICLLRTSATSSIRRLRDAHWSERARVASEWMQAGMPACIVCLITFLAMTRVRSASGCLASSRMLVWSVGLLGLGVLAIVYVVGIANAYRGTALSWSERIRSLFALLVILHPALIPIVLTAQASPFAPTGDGLLAWCVGVAGVIYLFGTGVTYPLARATGLAWPARDAIQRVVQRAAQESGASVTSIDEIAWAMPNALALPLGRRVAFTKVAADALTESEAYAIAKHEIGHLKEPVWVRWWRPAQSLVALPVVLAFPLLEAEAEGTLGILLLLGVAAIALLVINIRVSRRHELHADAHAAPAAASYATALEKLHRLAGVPAVLSKSATHPSLYDRMNAAGVTPDFPRPNPPSARRALLVALAMPVAWILGNTPPWSALAADALGGSNTVRVALGGTAYNLVALAEEVRPANVWFSDQLLGQAVARRGFKILPEVSRTIGMAPCDSLRNLIPKLEPDRQSESTRLLEHCDDAMVHRLSQSRRARAR